MTNSVYERMIITKLCSDQGDDGNYGSCAVSDIAALQALSKRIHFGKFIAEVCDSSVHDSPSP